MAYISTESLWLLLITGPGTDSLQKFVITGRDKTPIYHIYSLMSLKALEKLTEGNVLSNITGTVAL